MNRLALFVSGFALAIAAAALLFSLDSGVPVLPAPTPPPPDLGADEARDRAIESLAREVADLRRRLAEPSSGSSDPGGAGTEAADGRDAAVDENRDAADAATLSPRVLLLRLNKLTGPDPDPARALRLAEDLLGRNLEDEVRTDVLIRKGIALRALDRFSDAETVFTDAIRFAEPGSTRAAWAMSLIAWGRVEQDDHRTAADWMDRAAAQENASDLVRLDARVRAAQFLLQAGDRDLARERIAPVIEEFREGVPPGLEVPISMARDLWRKLGD